MAKSAKFSREEQIGLLVAGVAHAALVAALLVQAGKSEPYTPPERITVSLATEVSLESTAPDPSLEAAASTAPTLSDQPAPEIVEQVEAAVPTATPEPARQPVRQPTPRRAQSEPTPTPRPTQAPREPVRQQSAPPRQASGSSLSDDFVSGMSDGAGASSTPASQAGPAQRASIAQAVQRQLKPHWNPPSGVEVERLVTLVRFSLNSDGSLAGNPVAVRTDGQNAANRAQVGRHQEQAVRAVRLAAPFNLPERFYSVWRRLETNFDNRLAQ